MKSTFKSQFIHIFCIKYYITQEKIIKVKVVKERLKKSNMDNNSRTEVVTQIKLRKTEHSNTYH